MNAPTGKCPNLIYRRLNLLNVFGFLPFKERFACMITGKPAETGNVEVNLPVEVFSVVFRIECP